MKVEKERWGLPGKAERTEGQVDVSTETTPRGNRRNLFSSENMGPKKVWETPLYTKPSGK